MFLSAKAKLDLAISMLRVGCQKDGLTALWKLAESFDDLIGAAANGTADNHPAVIAFKESEAETAATV